MVDYWELKNKFTPKHERFINVGAVVQEAIEEVVNSETPETPAEETEKSLVVEAGNGKLYLTGRAVDLVEVASMARPFQKIRGRYVQAEKANLNGRIWTVGDLEHGQPSIVFSPANLLHDDSKIVGCISEAKLVTDSVEYGPHMTTEITVWSFLYPQVARMLEQESAQKSLFLSMECIAEEVQCFNGCMENFDYRKFMSNKASACSHLSSGGVARLVNPTFLGVGLIVLGIKSGWSDASAEVVREAAKISESSELSDIMTRKEAESLILSVMKWANS